MRHLRRTFIGLVTAGVLLVGACSDDDGGESGSVLGGDSPTGGTGNEPGGQAGGDGYDDEMRDNFVTSCTAGASGAEDEAECGCMWDQIVANIPYEEYVAYEEALRSGEGMDAPEGLMDAISAC